jgi:hypothetical protein
MSELLNDAREEFTVTDDAAAEWCMKKIKEAEADRAMWKAHYEAQMEKVNKAADESIAYFTAKLEEYFSNVPHKATKTQESYTLPGGKLIRKKQQPKFETDDEALVPWLEDNFMGQLVKVKKSADWAALKKVVSVTPDGEHVATDEGEIIPGVTVTQRPDVFKVEMEDEE